MGELGSTYEGKLIFPWSYGVVLANICRKAFAGTDLGNVIPLERVICQDEMVASVDAEACQQRRWGDARGAGYRPGDGSPAGAARKEHGGGPSGDSRRGRLGQGDDPGLPRAASRAGDGCLKPGSPPKAAGTTAEGGDDGRGTAEL